MKLIINADDLGLSKSISDGIIEGIKGGYITSTSLMANMKYTEYAIKEAIKNNVDCIGLHINLTVGKPILNNSNLVDEKGVFLYNKKQIENSKLTYEDVYNEIIAQLNMINELSDGNIKIDHLDTHHYIGMGTNESIKKAIIDAAKTYKLPIRNEFECNILKPDILYTNFTMSNVNIDSLKNMLLQYQNQNITLELVVHPGYVDDYTKTVTSYLNREKELRVLKESNEQGLFNKVKLIKFRGL